MLQEKIEEIPINMLQENNIQLQQQKYIHFNEGQLASVIYRK